MIRLPKHRAFTILELLVVAGIFAIILVFTSTLFFRGRDAVRLSSDKIDTAGRSRRTMDALTPLVGSAVETGGFEALEVADVTPLDLSDACHLDITTRENFLASDYTPTEEFDVRGPYYRFRVAYEPETERLLLYRLNLVPVGIDSDVSPRLLAAKVLGCRFEPVTVGSVAVTIKIRAEREDERRPGGITTTTLNAILVSPGSR